jgi:AraC-like DNA-binding protein
MLIATPPPLEISYDFDGGFDFKEHRYSERGELESIREDVMICVQFGASRHRVGGQNKPFHLVPPSAMVSAPGVRTAMAWEGVNRSVPVRISPDFIEAALGEIFDPVVIASRPFARDRAVDDHDIILSQIIGAMVLDARAGNPAGLIFQQTMAVALVHRVILPIASKNMPRTGGRLSALQLRRVMDRIEGDLSTKLSLGQLAEEAGVSTRYLCSAFRASTGMSPYQYVLHRRVDEARDLIGGGGMSLTEAALAVGFSDHSQMSKTFRKLLGRSPSSFLGGD